MCGFWFISTTKERGTSFRHILNRNLSSKSTSMFQVYFYPITQRSKDEEEEKKGEENYSFGELKKAERREEE